MNIQYEFFRSLYDDEERTSAQLVGKAKVYLGIITAFLVALLLKAEEVANSADTLGIPWWGILGEALILGASLLCVVYSLGIRRFEAANDGLEIIEAFGEVHPTDAEFYEDRIADLAVASSHNRKVNNDIATILAWAGGLLFTGMLLLFALITYSLLNFPWSE